VRGSFGVPNSFKVLNTFPNRNQPPDLNLLKGFLLIFSLPADKKIDGSKPINGLIPENHEHSHHSTKDPLHAFHPSQSSFRIEPSLESRRFVPHETIKPPLLSFSLVFLTMTTIPLISSQSLSCNALFIYSIILMSLKSNYMFYLNMWYVIFY